MCLSITLFCLTNCAGNSQTNPTPEVIRFKSGDVFLEGQLDLPGSKGPYPLAVFIHGSGRATRDDYQEFVTPLIKAGIAVFRYDKRGVGESGGEYGDVGVANSKSIFRTLASDAIAAVKHLKNDSRINDKRIILIGGSQAGWIIPEANTLGEVHLSVCISGPAVSVGEEIFYSDLAERGAYSQQEADEKLKDFNGMHGFDPQEKIKRMKAPSLWVFGGKDVSIPIKKTISILKKLKEEEKLPLEIKLYPEGDHGIFNRSLNKNEGHVEFVTEWIKAGL